MHRWFFSSLFSSICIYICMYIQKRQCFFSSCAQLEFHIEVNMDKIAASDLRGMYLSIIFSISWETSYLWRRNLLTVTDNLLLVVAEWLSNRLVVAVVAVVENIDKLEDQSMIHWQDYYVVDWIDEMMDSKLNQHYERHGNPISQMIVAIWYMMRMNNLL
jgi:hypothetical protein